tara:strand:- start:1361 stop:2224 length:864 start_codon:yes stop_codon:yes gene_type:complete
MQIDEHVPLAPKTTMRIGGEARFYAEPTTKKEVEEAATFAEEKGLPLILLGGGSNTIFADGKIDAVVMRIKTEDVSVEGNTITVRAGKNLPMLVNELADQGLNLAPLTGIPGSIGGAVVGNAGQGPRGIWIDSIVDSVTAFVDGEWKTFSKGECHFAYRESAFKKMHPVPIIWEVQLTVPQGDPDKIKTEIEYILQQRIETQPHVKTSGSCFKAVGNTPAWQLIDAVQLRGAKAGGVQISEKHANFLINEGDATFADVVSLIDKVQHTVSEPLEVEMRLIQENGIAL